MLNLLSASVKIFLQFTKEAYNSLPEVSKSDYQTGIEKYRTLIGTKKQIGNNFFVLVHHVHDFVDFYKASSYEIEYVDLEQIDLSVKLLSKTQTKFKGMEVVGEIHTHPLLPGECEPVESWKLSQIDYESILEMYNSNVLTPYRPYVFGVGGLLHGGETGYRFYHLEKYNQGYIPVKVDWLPDKEFVK